jgi:hypothetical protein
VSQYSPLAAGVIERLLGVFSLKGRMIDVWGIDLLAAARKGPQR